MDGSDSPHPPAPPVPPPLPFHDPLQGYYPVPAENDRTLAMLCHLLAIFTGFLGPLILWLVKKDSSPFVDFHGREAINFQITTMLAIVPLSVVMFILLFLVVGIFLIPVIMVLAVLILVAEILACMAASRGEWHRYPWCLRLV